MSGSEKGPGDTKKSDNRKPSKGLEQNEDIDGGASNGGGDQDYDAACRRRNEAFETAKDIGIDSRNFQTARATIGHASTLGSTFKHLMNGVTMGEAMELKDAVQEAAQALRTNPVPPPEDRENMPPPPPRTPNPDAKGKGKGRGKARTADPEVRGKGKGPARTADPEVRGKGKGPARTADREVRGKGKGPARTPDPEVRGKGKGPARNADPNVEGKGKGGGKGLALTPESEGKGKGRGGRKGKGKGKGPALTPEFEGKKRRQGKMWGEGEGDGGGSLANVKSEKGAGSVSGGSRSPAASSDIQGAREGARVGTVRDSTRVNPI